MTRKAPVNLAESVRQRLLNLARSEGEDFQVTLNNYLLERFLYRLSRSAAHNRFVLKGALLLRLWAEHPYRATLDFDLLRQGQSDEEAVAADIRAICATIVDPDGVEFDTRDLTPGTDTRAPGVCRAAHELYRKTWQRPDTATGGYRYR